MKRFFFRGLAALLPLVATIFILVYVVRFLYYDVGSFLGGIVHGAANLISADLAEYLKSSNWHLPAIGFVIAIVLIWVVGFFVATFLGRKLMQLAEWLLRHLPLVRVVYPYAKQFTEFLFSGEEQKRMQFKTPVALPFPAHGMYSIGFVTSEGLKVINEVTGKRFVCVFVPTSPTPFTGFIVYVPREEIIPLPISVEEAMRLFISAGVLAPPHQVEGGGIPVVGMRPAPEAARPAEGGTQNGS